MRIWTSPVCVSMTAPRTSTPWSRWSSQVCVGSRSRTGCGLCAHPGPSAFTSVMINWRCSVDMSPCSVSCTSRGDPRHRGAGADASCSSGAGSTQPLPERSCWAPGCRRRQGARDRVAPGASGPARPSDPARRSRQRVGSTGSSVAIRASGGRALALGSRCHRRDHRARTRGSPHGPRSVDPAGVARVCVVGRGRRNA